MRCLEVLNYCDDFKKIYAVHQLHPRMTHFDFARNYEDTRRFGLFINDQTQQHLVASGADELGNTEFLPSSYKHGAYLAMSLPTQQHYDYLAEHNNEYYGLHLVMPSDGYTDFLYFAFDEPNPEYLNFYLSHMNALKKHAYLLLKESKKLIESAAPYAWVKPYRQSQNIITACEQARSRVDIQPVIKKLSKRELECCFYIAKGCTSKVIANQLYISHRTVETHIENIRNKIADYLIGYPSLCLALRAIFQIY